MTVELCLSEKNCYNIRMCYILWKRYGYSRQTRANVTVELCLPEKEHAVITSECVTPCGSDTVIVDGQEPMSYFSHLEKSLAVGWSGGMDFNKQLATRTWARL